MRDGDRIAQVVVDRIVFGSDAITPGKLAPREGWAAVRALPLTGATFGAIATNIAPYLRQRPLTVM